MQTQGSSDGGSWVDIGSLADGLASVSPSPPLNDPKADLDNSINLSRPDVRPTVSAPSSTRRKRWPGDTWHTVEINGGGILSPRRPRWVAQIKIKGFGLKCIFVGVAQETTSIHFVILCCRKPLREVTEWDTPWIYWKDCLRLSPSLIFLRCCVDGQEREPPSTASTPHHYRL